MYINVFRWLPVRCVPRVQGACLQDAHREVVGGAGACGGGGSEYATLCPVFVLIHKLLILVFDQTVFQSHAGGPTAAESWAHLASRNQ